MKKEIYIGLMSGTSLDAIDAALVEFLPQRKINLLATHSQPIPPKLRAEILELCQPGSDSVHKLAKVDIALGNALAQSSMKLLERSHVPREKVVAIGSHGQTIRHVPDATPPFTIQIGDPNIIACVTNITTVGDFRRRDIALGGQAAPLAPAFHRYLFSHPNKNRFIVNIGGIANVTFLPSDSENASIIGFDTGPGNTLLDNWCLKHKGVPFDNNGEWAASGKIIPSLLKKLLNDPYFHKKAPKSTGREYFNLHWLEKYDLPFAAVDIQTTLAELTAVSIAEAILALKRAPTEVFVCGGGAFNLFLLDRIRANLINYRIDTTECVGLHPSWVEAVTFAWLARQTIHHQPGNLPSVTGARKATILGAIYPTTNQ
ncbi:MAG: anhydro-N-acetylmuramic acid kinase [Coxiella sp. RIFCSPHIGHO2_12_FULL_42_15]|nr:MAG: anhydro-N-acetylmuramic acid kinase [Coxiella sp. RIFCSPHIGHO2_12_FULL_42_15]